MRWGWRCPETHSGCCLEGQRNSCRLSPCPPPPPPPRRHRLRRHHCRCRRCRCRCLHRPEAWGRCHWGASSARTPTPRLRAAGVRRRPRWASSRQGCRRGGCGTRASGERRLQLLLPGWWMINSSGASPAKERRRERKKNAGGDVSGCPFPPPSPLARLSSRPPAVRKSGSSRAACSLFPLPHATQCPPIPHFSPHPVLFPPLPLIPSPPTVLSLHSPQLLPPRHLGPDQGHPWQRDYPLSFKKKPWVLHGWAVLPRQACLMSTQLL